MSISTMVLLFILILLAYVWGSIVGKRVAKRKNATKEILNIDSGNSLDKWQTHYYYCPECFWEIKIQSNIEAVQKNSGELATKMHRAEGQGCTGFLEMDK